MEFVFKQINTYLIKVLLPRGILNIGTASGMYTSGRTTILVGDLSMLQLPLQFESLSDSVLNIPVHLKGGQLLKTACKRS